MRRVLCSLSLMLALLVASVAPALADGCYADYKARAGPAGNLRLHYGTARIDGRCEIGPAEAELRPRLREGGWQLLTVVSVFGEEGLDERRETAGDYHLRF